MNCHESATLFGGVENLLDEEYLIYRFGPGPYIRGRVGMLESG